MTGAFEAYLLQRVSAGVARQYARAVEQYRAAAAAIESAGYSEVVAYVGHLRRKRALSDSAVGGHVAAIRHYYAWLVATGVRGDDPTAALELRNRRRDRGVTAPEELYPAAVLEAWLASIPAEAPAVRRVAAGLLVYQALAPRELVGVEVGAVDLAAGTIRAPGSGSLDARTLPLRASQVLQLDTYVKGERAEAVAGGMRGRWAPAGGRGREAATAALLVTEYGRPFGRQDVPRLINGRRRGDGKGDDEEGESDYLLPLRIRQSVIAGLLSGGHDVRVVQALAGHRSAATTEAYRTDGLEDLARAIWRLHPRQ